MSSQLGRSRRRAVWERIAPHWRTVLAGAIALAALLWLVFERTAS